MNNLQLDRLPSLQESGSSPVPLSDRSALRYQKHDSLKAMMLEGEKVTVETDADFGDSLAAIVKSKASVLAGLLGAHDNALTARECEEIHHKARLHARANLLNRNSGLDGRAARRDRALLSQLCGCGCGRMEGELFELCGDLQRVSLLGSGVLLFFFFLKALCLCLVGLALTQGVFALGSNLGGVRAEKGCQWSCGWRDWASHYNKENDWFAEIQGWLGLAGMCVWMVLARFLKYYGGERSTLIDRSLTSASDYAIKIDNLPAGEFNQQELMQYINRIYQRELAALPPEHLAAILVKIPLDKTSQKLVPMEGVKGLEIGMGGGFEIGLQLVRKAVREAAHSEDNPFGVRAVQVIYDMRFARQMVQKLSEQAQVLHKQLIRLDGKLVVAQPELYMTRKRELINTHELLGDLRKKFLSDCEFRRKIATRSAIVEFQEEQGKQLVLDRFGRENMTLLKRLKQRVKACCWGENHALVMRGSLPQIGRAPQPSDIIWQNCERQDSLMRLVFIFMATLLIILASLGIIVALQAAQTYIEQRKLTDANGSLGTVINLASSLVLQVVNKLLWLALSLLLALEYNHTNTVRIISQMAKSSTAMAVNVIVLPIVVNYVIRVEYFGASGLAGIVLDYHLTALLISLPLKLLDPLALLLRLSLEIRPLRNYLIRARFGSRLGGAQRAGLMRRIYQLYEPPEFDIAQAYIFIISNVLHACFFCELQPAVLLLVFLQVLLFYWVCKWRLLRFCKIPQLTEKLVFEVACYQAMLAPVFYGVGAIFNSFASSRALSDQQFHFLAPAICVGIGLLNYFNPADIFHRLTKWTANCCTCLQPENFLGSAAVNKPELPSLSAMSVPGEEGRSVRVEDYYKYSNSLSLLGFERVLLGEAPGQETEEELRMYCESHVEDCGASSESSKRASEAQSQEEMENERSDNILF